jgi:hypothetical protein
MAGEITGHEQLLHWQHGMMAEMLNLKENENFSKALTTRPSSGSSKSSSVPAKSAASSKGSSGGKKKGRK